MRDTIKRKISGFAYGMALMAVIIFIAIILIEPFIGRRYYSISKEQLVKMEMESAASLNVPLTVDVTVGKNWLEQN